MIARANPFASEYLESLPFCFPPGLTWDLLFSRLEALGWRAAIVGPHGTGKTTLIEQMLPQIEARGFRARAFSLRRECTVLEKRRLLEEVRPFSAPDFLLIDGAEQLTTREWLIMHSATAQCAGTIITLHRPGRLPVLFETTPSPGLLGDLAQTLSGAPLAPSEAAALFLRHRGNLRDCLRELYDRQTQ